MLGFVIICNIAYNTIISNDKNAKIIPNLYEKLQLIRKIEFQLN